MGKVNIGDRFSRLTVLEESGFNNGGNKMWLCKCDCGNFYRATTTSLFRNKVKSCGCYRIECIKKCNSKLNPVSETKLYKRWQDMRYRCNNKNDTNYKNYGGRGIKVCEDWNKSFSIFQKWALENGYKEELSIDRINNNGNYEPNNCRFVDFITQQNNKSTNKCYTYKGEFMSLKDLCRKYNQNYWRVQGRLRHGKNIEYALEKESFRHDCKPFID